MLFFIAFFCLFWSGRLSFSALSCFAYVRTGTVQALISSYDHTICDTMIPGTTQSSGYVDTVDTAARAVGVACARVWAVRLPVSDHFIRKILFCFLPLVSFSPSCNIIANFSSSCDHTRWISFIYHRSHHHHHDSFRDHHTQLSLPTQQAARCFVPIPWPTPVALVSLGHVRTISCMLCQHIAHINLYTM